MEEIKYAFGIDDLIGLIYDICSLDFIDFLELFAWLWDNASTIRYICHKSWLVKYSCITTVIDWNLVLGCCGIACFKYMYSDSV